jgi:uncharacterized protein (DUF302 family)
MLYTREARGTVPEVVQKLEEAAKANKFGVIGTINLTERIQAKGVDFVPQCVVIEVCNPVQAKKVLESNMAISTALPCRISVYEESGKVKVATLRPTAMLGLFGSPDLAPVAQSVEESVVRIIDTACG